MTLRRSAETRTGIYLVLTLLFSVFLGACATTEEDDGSREASVEVPMEARSGFLQDYDRLERVPGEEAVLRWVNAEGDWNQYDRFLVDPVQFRVPPAYKDQAHPREEAVAAMTRYFREAMVRELGSRYEVVDEPAAGVMRIRAALTSIKPTAKQLEAWQYLPVALVATGVAEATGLRGEDALLFMEGEASDSLNGEIMGEVMQGRISEESHAKDALDMTAEDIEPVLDYWASELVRTIKKARAQSS